MRPVMHLSRRLAVLVLPIFVALAQTSSALVLIGSGGAHQVSFPGRAGFGLILHHHDIAPISHHHDDADTHAGSRVETHRHEDETAPQPDHVVRDATEPGLVREVALAAGHHSPLGFVAIWSVSTGDAIFRPLDAPRWSRSGPAPPLSQLATIILRI